MYNYETGKIEREREKKKIGRIKIMKQLTNQQIQINNKDNITGEQKKNR